MAYAFTRQASRFARLAGTPPDPLLPTRAAQLVNRMLYRSRQRGFLELDLLIVSACRPTRAPPCAPAWPHGTQPAAHDAGEAGAAVPCLATARPALCADSPHTEGGPSAVPARMVHAVALQPVDGPPGLGWRLCRKGSHRTSGA